MNPSLALAIQKAKAANMTNDNIDRAVQKGMGGGKDGEELFEIVYEGYGPHGVAVMVRALTNSKNRTAGSVRHIFSKAGGNLGETNSVSYLFSKKGIIDISFAPAKREQVEELILESGADDFEELDENTLQVFCDPLNLHAVRQFFSKNPLVTIQEAKFGYVPGTSVDVPDTATEDVMNFLEELEDDEDVDEIFTNVQFTDHG